MILDNCEHIVDAAARLADSLVDACAGLRILATSREALDAPGEVAWPVPPLSRPDPRCPPWVRTGGSGIGQYGGWRWHSESCLPCIDSRARRAVREVYVRDEGQNPNGGSFLFSGSRDYY